MKIFKNELSTKQNENLKEMAQIFSKREPYLFLKDIETQEKIKEEIIENARDKKRRTKFIVVDFKQDIKNMSNYIFQNLSIPLTNYNTTFDEFMKDFWIWITSMGFNKSDIIIEKSKYTNAINYVYINW